MQLRKLWPVERGGLLPIDRAIPPVHQGIVGLWRGVCVWGGGVRGVRSSSPWVPDPPYYRGRSASCSKQVGIS